MAAPEPHGLIQRSYPTRDGRTMWRVFWPAGDGPPAVASEGRFETGQAVRLTADGRLERLR